MEHLGYEWEQVHVVDDQFLQDFPEGRPIHVLQKCAESPHIYRIEDGRKRWIRDIATLESEGHAWGDVQIVPCVELSAKPSGSPIPPDAGTPAPDESTGASEGGGGHDWHPVAEVGKSGRRPQLDTEGPWGG
jgi:hypothetical protein